MKSRKNGNQKMSNQTGFIANWIAEQNLAEVKLEDIRDELEYAFEWDYVEQEGGDSVRFDWGRGRKSMWIHKNGEATGEIPRNSDLEKAMKKLRIRRDDLAVMVSTTGTGFF